MKGNRRRFLNYWIAVIHNMLWPVLSSTVIFPLIRLNKPPCTNFIEPDILSDIIVSFMVMKGKLPSLTEFCFLSRLTVAGVLKNTQISDAWNALTHNMDPVRFFLSGPSLLKTFLLEVNRAYYPEESWKQFTALILSKTDSYFHQMVTKVFDTAMYAQRGEGGNVEIVCD